jgi:hypothetical protein
MQGTEKLKSVPKPELKFSDAYDLISKKILINKLSIKNLQAQIDYSHTSAQLQLLSVKLAREKIKLVKEMTPILEKQLTEFDETRQDQCVDLYDQINKIDNPTEEWRKLVKKLEKHQEEMCNLLPKIQQIEATIPPSLRVTNFRIKPKEEPSTAFNCATEAMAFGSDQPPPLI